MVLVLDWCRDQRGKLTLADRKPDASPTSFFLRLVASLYGGAHVVIAVVGESTNIPDDALAHTSFRHSESVAR